MSLVVSPALSAEVVLLGAEVNMLDLVPERYQPPVLKTSLVFAGQNC